MLAVIQDVPFSAESLRTLLADVRLPKLLQTADHTTFSPELCAKIGEFRATFDKPDTLKKGMKALFLWLHALGTLYNARSALEPRQKQLQQWREDKENALRAVEKKKTEVEQVEGHLALLRNMHRAAVRAISAPLIGWSPSGFRFVFLWLVDLASLTM